MSEAVPRFSTCPASRPRRARPRRPLAGWRAKPDADGGLCASPAPLCTLGPRALPDRPLRWATPRRRDRRCRRGCLRLLSRPSSEVFKAAILASATAIIAAHNHPSGDLTPSDGDRLVTKRLAETGASWAFPSSTTSSSPPRDSIPCRTPACVAVAAARLPALAYTHPTHRAATNATPNHTNQWVESPRLAQRSSPSAQSENRDPTIVITAQRNIRRNAIIGVSMLLSWLLLLSLPLVATASRAMPSQDALHPRSQLAPVVPSSGANPQQRHAT